MIKHKIDDTDYEFDLPNVPQLDRYLSKAASGLVTASIRMALDTCKPEFRPELSSIFVAMPGHAVQIATAQLAARGFTSGAAPQD